MSSERAGESTERVPAWYGLPVEAIQALRTWVLDHPFWATTALAERSPDGIGTWTIGLLWKGPGEPDRVVRNWIGWHEGRWAYWSKADNAPKVALFPHLPDFGHPNVVVD